MHNILLLLLLFKFWDSPHITNIKIILFKNYYFNHQCLHGHSESLRKEPIFEFQFHQ